MQWTRVLLQTLSKTMMRQVVGASVHQAQAQAARDKEFTETGTNIFGETCYDDVTDLYDRFIPNREGQDLQATYSLLGEDGCPSTPSRTKKRTPHGELHFQRSM